MARFERGGRRVLWQYRRTAGAGWRTVYFLDLPSGRCEIVHPPTHVHVDFDAASGRVLWRWVEPVGEVRYDRYRLQYRSALDARRPWATLATVAADPASAVQVAETPAPSAAVLAADGFRVRPVSDRFGDGWPAEARLAAALGADGALAVTGSAEATATIRASATFTLTIDPVPAGYEGEPVRLGATAGGSATGAITDWIWSSTVGSMEPSSGRAGRSTAANPIWTRPQVDQDQHRVRIGVSASRQGRTAAASVRVSVLNRRPPALYASIFTTPDGDWIYDDETFDFDATPIGGSGQVTDRRWWVVSGGGSIQTAFYNRELTGGLYTPDDLAAGATRAVVIGFEVTKGGQTAETSYAFTVRDRAAGPP